MAYCSDHFRSEGLAPSVVKILLVLDVFLTQTPFSFPLSTGTRLRLLNTNIPTMSDNVG